MSEVPTSTRREVRRRQLLKRTDGTAVGPTATAAHRCSKITGMLLALYFPCGPEEMLIVPQTLSKLMCCGLGLCVSSQSKV